VDIKRPGPIGHADDDAVRADGGQRVAHRCDIKAPHRREPARFNAGIQRLDLVLHILPGRSRVHERPTPRNLPVRYDARELPVRQPPWHRNHTCRGRNRLAAIAPNTAKRRAALGLELLDSATNRPPELVVVEPIGDAGHLPDPHKTGGAIDVRGVERERFAILFFGAPPQLKVLADRDLVRRARVVAGDKVDIMIDAGGSATGRLTDSDGLLSVSVQDGRLAITNTDVVRMTTLALGAKGVLVLVALVWRTIAPVMLARKSIATD